MKSNKKEPLTSLLRQMLLIRRFEEKTAEMYALGKIAGFCHLYIGEEAVAVGAISAAREDDYLVTAYRDHGHAIARGVEPKRVMAELFGKATGVSKGKGGSMHLFDVSRHFMGGYAIVGGHIPLATGIGFAMKYEKRDQVVLCFFGEGSVPSGNFHESLNLAALWRLPVIYICENNRFGMGTPVERASAIYDIAHVAKAYDMPYHHIDGMDVVEVYRQMKRIIEAVRTSKRPIFIEARTYRYMGHSMSDPAHGHYRTKAEIDEQKKRDPIANLQHQLLEKKEITPEEIKKMEAEIQDIVQEAVEFADKSPEPPLSSLTEDVYA
ncbi:MAG TPA: pyruvate dehydrogenase (acetyl-transferring) E1 component subunit alpha [Candidatus Manganitrophaceae bacterium]|nr:pyruvate dehydrogenase (acetyl-transferring) E1 component subunit alpha [Candidatus Manganitrophaceae bacterium]